MRMERLGTQRAATFSWERTAAKTLELYYEIAGQAKSDPATATKSMSAAHK